MALSNAALKNLILAELEAQGINTSGEHAKAAVIATAVANAVVTHLTLAGIVTVTVGSGSSAGAWPGVIS